jgi:imidazolonepropionase-like amidohydrolase
MEISDYRTRIRAAQVAPRMASDSIATFHRDELEAMISTAHKIGVKVAAHSSLPSSISTLLDLGIDSIEHGSYMSDDSDRAVIKRFAATPNTFWCPTLAVVYSEWLRNSVLGKAVWEKTMKTFKIAMEEGMENIASGGDTGAFTHGENALELKLMARLGAPWPKVLRWATLNGWKCIRSMDWEKNVGIPFGELGDNDVPFGCVKKGWAADLVGLEGDLAMDFEKTLDKVMFVMKAGKVYKYDGRELSVNGI